MVGDIMAERRTPAPLVDGLGTRSRAYVQVQNGCDHRCTFCIIPYGRGNARCVPAATVTEQVRRLVDRGYNEVVLRGRLREALERINPHMPAEAIEKAVHGATAINEPTLVRRNHAFHRLMIDGVFVEWNEEGLRRAQPQRESRGHVKNGGRRRPQRDISGARSK